MRMMKSKWTFLQCSSYQKKITALGGCKINGKKKKASMAGMNSYNNYKGVVVVEGEGV